MSNAEDTLLSHQDKVHDCVIVGAGPAGLSAALMLARYQRVVLTLHHGSPRNMYTHGVHGFLGHDGIHPAELLERGRSDVSKYGGVIIEERVTAITRRDDGEFSILARGEFRSRTVLLATGLRDVTPTCDGLLDFYGSSVHHCPDCDGYEVRGKRVAVIGSGRKAAAMIQALRTWTSDLVLLTDGQQEDPNEGEPGVPAHTAPVIRLEGDIVARKVQRVRLADGSAVECDAIFFNLGIVPASDFHEKLGCKVDDETGLVWVDQRQQTSVPGVYAAGDLTPLSQLAVVAAAQGALAAIQIHKSLLNS